MKTVWVRVRTMLNVCIYVQLGKIEKVQNRQSTSQHEELRVSVNKGVEWLFYWVGKISCLSGAERTGERRRRGVALCLTADL